MNKETKDAIIDDILEQQKYYRTFKKKIFVITPTFCRHKWFYIYALQQMGFTLIKERHNLYLTWSEQNVKSTADELRDLDVPSVIENWHIIDVCMFLTFAMMCFLFVIFLPL